MLNSPSKKKALKALQQSFILKTNTLINKQIPTNKANTTLAILNQTASLSFSKPLFQAIIPSMLATASILSTPLEAGWQSNANALNCNSPCKVISATAGDKDAIIFATGQAGDLTIDTSVSLVNTKQSTSRGYLTSVIQINGNGKTGTITNKGTISGAGFGISVGGTVSAIKIESGASVYGKLAGITNYNKIDSITIESGASVKSNTSNGWAIYNARNATAKSIEVKGEVTGKFAIINDGTISGGITIASGASVEGTV